MQRFSVSLKVLAALVVLYAVLAAVSVFLPQPPGMADSSFPAPLPIVALANAGIILFVYGGLGYAGYLLSKKTSLPEIWDPAISLRKKFIVPMVVGIISGLILIAGDLIFAKYNTIGRLQHPPFPLSFLASFTAGIGEEIMFRLFFISFWMWLISIVILKGRGKNTVFIIVSVFSAMVFSMAHLPAVMFLYGWMSFTELPGGLLLEIIVLNSILSFFAIYYFRKYGLLAAIGIHFWCDIVWHFIGPLLMNPK